MKKKVVLAYSGGLDTSVAIKWLAEKYSVDIVAFTVNIGGVKNLDRIRKKAIKVGAVKAIILNATDIFINSFVFPALKANAMYENQYPLATALGRPLMAKLLVDVAKAEGAYAIAHGSTGKGNDQVRFDVSVSALAPELEILAPAREWKMNREETIRYAKRNHIPIPISSQSPYSIDENIWGRSIECGILEDPWVEPPADAYAWTQALEKAPAKAEYIEIGFDKGVPVTIDGKKLCSLNLINKANSIAGKHGIGRIDHIESRLIGIKSREIYEAPAATLLLNAHKALESMVLSKDQLKFKESVSREFSDIIYNGLWFSGHRENLSAYIESTQRYVTGIVRLKLHKGNCIVVGRKSAYSIYDHQMATYDKGDLFDHSASPGFIHIWGLPVRIQGKVQGGLGENIKYKASK
ncbi:MAG TPA: argininosuccinate synthase [Dehalococcoidia bacterium]|nr:argininosuccinate synthase [Dehalococcoidia bacterium]